MTIFLCGMGIIGTAISRADFAAVTIGDPQKPAALAEAIAGAYSRGGRDITIAAGVYHLPARHRDDTIIMEQWNDAHIHAAGVTMIFDDLEHRPLSFRKCKNVSWDGGTLLFVHPSFTQGRIVAMGADDAGNYCDWQIDAGYPDNIDIAKSTFDVVDQSTRLLKPQTGDWGTKHFETIGHDLYRLHYRKNETPGFAIKDWLVTRAPGGSAIAHMDGCERCTLANITFRNGGFATIFETGGAGANHYIKCKIQPGPRPDGATEEQLVGCGADGVHSTGTTAGPIFEDCIFTGVFLDDCIAIHGSFDRVIAAQGNTITLQHGWDQPVPGDPIRISNTDNFFAQAVCTAVEELPNHDLRITLDKDLNVPINHAQDDNPKLGTKANDPNHCGRGYKILRCRLGDTRSRGILVKADDGLIEGCTIEGCGMSGVSIGPEFWWNEANYVWKTTVTKNTFRQCSKNNGDQGSIWIHGDGAMGNRNITISDNRFESCYGNSILRVEDADGVDITTNQFNEPFPVKSRGANSILRIRHSRKIDLRDNMVDPSETPPDKLVDMDKTVDPTDVTDPSAHGIYIGN